MDPLDRVVAIGRRKDGSYTIVATGFLTAPDRVLTVRHFDDGGKGGKIQHAELFVRLPPSEDWIGVQGIHCESANKDVDVAVLQTTKGVANVEPARFGNAPRHGQSWRTAGFPYFAFGDAPDHSTVAASTYSGNVESRTEVTCSTWPSITAGDWMGISGAPEVVDDRIVGVICQYQGGTHNRLLVAPIERLLSDAAFREAVGLPPDDRSTEDEQTLRRAAVTILGRHPPVLGAVRSFAPHSAATAETIIDRLVSMEPVPLADLLDRVHECVLQGADPSAAAAAVELMNHILVIRRWGDRVSVREVYEGACRVVKLPASTRATTELSYRAIHGRPSRFKLLGGEAVGAHAVYFPEAGSRPETACRDMKEHLERAQEPKTRAALKSTVNYEKTRSPFYAVIEGSNANLQAAGELQAEFEIDVVRTREHAELDDTLQRESDVAKCITEVTKRSTNT